VKSTPTGAAGLTFRFAQISRRTRYSVPAILRMMAEETRLTARQAVAKGFADQVAECSLTPPVQSVH